MFRAGEFHVQQARVRALIGSALLITLNGCYGCPPTFLSNECRKFFDLPSREQEAKFRAYPVDKQVDFYLCGMNREPPEIVYAVYIADGGEKNIPYLLQRLKAEKLGITQTRILDIFNMLAIKGHLRGRQDVVAQLEQVVTKMQYEPVKLQAQRYLEEIKKNM